MKLNRLCSIYEKRSLAESALYPAGLIAKRWVEVVTWVILHPTAFQQVSKRTFHQRFPRSYWKPILLTFFIIELTENLHEVEGVWASPSW